MSNFKIRAEYEMVDDVNRIRICGECRGRFVSIHELINSRDCNFCDIPYILLESEELVKDSDEGGLSKNE